MGQQKRVGCIITRTRLAQEKGIGGASMGAFEALLELLDVYPLLPAETPLTVRSPAFGWKVFTRTEAVAALRFHEVRAALWKNRGGQPASVTGNLGVANSARRTVEVAGVHDVRGGRRVRGKLRFCCSRKNVEKYS